MFSTVSSGLKCVKFLFNSNKLSVGSEIAQHDAENETLILLSTNFNLLAVKTSNPVLPFVFLRKQITSLINLDANTEDKHALNCVALAPDSCSGTP